RESRKNERYSLSEECAPGSTRRRIERFSGLTMREQIAEIFDRKYRTALVVVTVLVLGNQLLVPPDLMRLTTDAPLINVAGRQRMLSQRLTKAALVYERRESERTDAARDEIKEVLGLWSAAHEQLRRSGTSAGPNSAAVRAGLASLEPDFVA